MVEPGVVRFGLGPLTEVVAQRHTFAELAPHLDAAVLPVVAQERVLRGEDLRADPRAAGAPDEPPLVLQPFEPAYVLPDYRDDERLDGAVPDPLEGVPVVDAEDAGGGRDAAGQAQEAAAQRTVRALEDVVDPWATQSGGEVRVRAVVGTVDDALHAVLDGSDAGAVRHGSVDVATLLALLAHAGASGGVHGRRRGGAAGRSLAWWVARCLTGLDGPEPVDPDELEFRLEDATRVAFRVPGEAAWRLELALAPPEDADHGPGDVAGGGTGRGAAGEWAVAVAAFDRSEPSHDPAPPGQGRGAREERA